MLDDKLWIFAYKMGSESAKALAEKLDVWIIKHEGSTFTGKKGRFILNWGAGTGVYNAKTGLAKLLNPPHLIDVAVNKRDFFDQMEGDNSPRIPHWTTSSKKAQAWLAMGYEVVARKYVEGAKGEGIVLMKKPLDFIPCPLYTIKVGNVNEYRVYMWNDEVLDVRIKLCNKDKKPDPDNMKYGEQYEFCELDDINEMPADCFTQAKLAARRLGLTTAGLDVVWDGRQAFVLEANTAPYLGARTVAKYSKKLKELVEAA